MDRITIVNLALSRIGQSPIQALDEGSAPADAAALVYDSCRRAVLQAFHWAFATKTARLALLPDAPVDWRFAYALPADCLQAVRLRDGMAPDSQGAAPEAAYCVRGRSLLSNATEPYLEYTADIVDENLYEAEFVEALVTKLSSELAMPVGAKAELARMYREEYEQVVRRSSAKSAGQFYEELPDNPYVDARF